MAALEETLIGKALWLHAGASIIPMSLENGQVWVLLYMTSVFIFASVVTRIVEVALKNRFRII